uniref:Uncharacterized protein n=1 Tax=Setaria italica TaxID=4555 RepID=K3XTX6_SETIT
MLLDPLSFKNTTSSKIRCTCENDRSIRCNQ